jgi:hypothetical protein
MHSEPLVDFQGLAEVCGGLVSVAGGEVVVCDAWVWF